MWIKLDDAILDNRKIIEVGPLGFALHVAAITWCGRNLTDGLIPKRRVWSLLCFDGYGTAMPAAPAMGGPDDEAFDPIDVEEIVEHLWHAGLWHDRGDCWELHDYLNYNPSREKVLAHRQHAREKKARQRLSPGESPPMSPGDIADCPVPVPTHPVPVPVPDPEKKILAIARTKEKRGTTWPEQFALDERKRRWALNLDLDADWEFNKFKDFHQAKGSRFVNWDAGFRTWLRNAVDFAARRHRG